MQEISIAQSRIKLISCNVDELSRWLFHSYTIKLFWIVNFEPVCRWGKLQLLI